MTRQELLEIKKKQLSYWQDEARKQTKEASRAVQKANQIEREVQELQNGKSV